MILPQIIYVPVSVLSLISQPGKQWPARRFPADTTLPSCTESLQQPTPDSSRVNLQISVRTNADRNSLPSRYASLLLDGVKQFFVAPRPLALTTYESPGFDARRGDTTEAHPTVEGHYELTLRRDGRISRKVVTGGTRDGGFDSAVVQAITALNQSALLPPLPEQVRWDSLSLTLGISDVSDTAYARRAVASSSFLSFATPSHRMIPPVVAPGRQVQPWYPRDLMVSGVSGKLVTRFVIQPNGEVDPRTPVTLWSTRDEFARSVDAMIRELHFTPMVIAGCSVRSLASLPFEFTVAR